MKRGFDFLGEEAASEDGDRIVVVPVPIEWSTSYIKGTASAPRAILEASRQIELYNASIDFDLEGSGIATVGDEIKDREALIAWMRNNRGAMRDALPVFLGGEHSITPWILEGLQPGEIGIVWLDAHGDLRESYEGERESHAAAARNSLRFGRIVEGGVRSISSEEKRFIDSSREVRVFAEIGEDFREAVSELPRNVYLSFDFDVVDPSLLRALGTPEPGGIQWNDICGLFDFLFSQKNVVAMDFVELAPRLGDETSNFIAARIVYEAVSRYLKNND